MQQKQFKRDVYNNIILPQETRIISNKQSNITPKGTRKRTNKAQNQWKEGNNKDQSRKK